MKQEEILQRNEAIALYMGWELKDGIWWDDPKSGFPHLPESLDFHSDWRALMPAVDKVMEESRMSFHMLNSFGNRKAARFGLGKNGVGDSPIEATWMAVSDWVLSRETTKSGDT